MTRRPAAARMVALLAGLALLPAARAACLVVAAHPDGPSLARVAIAASDPTFTLTYVHSVTRTPVRESYRIDGDSIVQTEIRFEQHGPGLPTEADEGGRFEQRNGQFIVTMHRRFASFAMRVHADQQWRLVAAGQRIDLATWGNRALVLHAQAGACPEP